RLLHKIGRRLATMVATVIYYYPFLNSFIRRININDSEAEIEYTCPIGLTGNRRNEVLSMGRLGSRGRTRTGTTGSAVE
ncbi:MAG TPA: hypothetical protein VKJ65_05685, partial [Phycisphaerae bacterium]|nr:hypothetical protein [Phycisphaerae bacterium]